MSRGRGNEDKSDEMVMQVLALIRRQERERAKQSEEKEEARSRYPDFEKIRERAARAITPLKPADKQSVAPKDLLFVAKSTNAGRRLPEPYLVYFLLVDLLDYQDLGRWEKLAYSIPVDLNGTAYLVEHRKFGLGLFSADPELQEDDATRIVHLIRKAVKVSQPYFEHLANEAADGSKLNLKNHSRALYDRYLFFRKIFHEKQEEMEKRKDERVVEDGVSENELVRWQSIQMPVFELRRESNWLGLAAVEAFFSWTEHVFIHIAVLRGTCRTGREVRTLANADWSAKLKAALFAGLRAVVEAAGSFAGTVFNCAMIDGTVAATAGDRFTAAGSAGVRSDRNWASVSNIPVTISWRSWHNFRVSCSIARADSASCLSATPASSRVSRSRGQPAMTDAAIGGTGMPDFGAGALGVRAFSPGPAGCGCPAAPPSSTRSRRLRPASFVAPVDGAIGGTERAGFEFTPAEPAATASADCVPGAGGETASSAEAPDAATIATRQAPSSTGHLTARREKAAVIRASTRHGRRARARDSCWPPPCHRGSRSVCRATSATHRPSRDCRCRLPIPR